jgi:Tol biopolymer transport system component
MAKGSVLPGETVARRDPDTGVRVWQITNDASINHNFYFLTPSMTPDGASVLFASNRGGASNFYQAGFPEGTIRQLTDGDAIHGYSATLGRNGETLYFTQGGAVRALDMMTLEERVLADFGAASLGECSLNATESLPVMALKRDGAFQLAVVATDGSDSRIIKTSPQTLIHPQFHPSAPDLIAYSADPAPRMRMIRADGGGDELLWRHSNDEFIVHETFLGEDDLILVRWPYALQRFSLGSRRMTEIAAFNAWHIAPTRDGPMSSRIPCTLISACRSSTWRAA